MSAGGSPAVTQLLERWRGGDRRALDEVLPLIYRELRKRAAAQLRRERRGHTLQPTALVHEAFLRLSRQRQPHWESRLHFLAVAGRLMRQILVDHERQRRAEKRGGGAVAVSLDEARDQPCRDATDLLALDDALRQLEHIDPRKARVIDLRFFSGLTLEETAQVLGVSVRTVLDEAQFARAWLYQQMSQ